MISVWPTISTDFHSSIHNNMAKKSSTTGIPGLSFSWKRAVGLTQLRQKVSHTLGIPTTKQGLERKVGALIIASIFGKKK